MLEKTCQPLDVVFYSSCEPSSIAFEARDAISVLGKVWILQQERIKIVPNIKKNNTVDY